MFNSHGPAIGPEATEVTQLLRLGRKKGGEEKKASLYIGYFGDSFWMRKNYLKQGFLLRAPFHKFKY